MVYLTMLKSLTGLPGDLANRHNLPLAWHEATDMSAIGWGNDCKQFKLSHKPEVAGLNCGGWQYNKRNFTFTIQLTQHEVCVLSYTYFLSSPH